MLSSLHHGRFRRIVGSIGSRIYTKWTTSAPPLASPLPPSITTLDHSSTTNRQFPPTYTLLWSGAKTLPPSAVHIAHFHTTSHPTPPPHSLLTPPVASIPQHTTILFLQTHPTNRHAPQIDLPRTHLMRMSLPLPHRDTLRFPDDVMDTDILGRCGQSCMFITAAWRRRSGKENRKERGWCSAGSPFYTKWTTSAHPRQTHSYPTVAS